MAEREEKTDGHKRSCLDIACNLTGRIFFALKLGAE